MTIHEQISKSFARHNAVLKKQWPEFSPTADVNWIINNSNLPWIKLLVNIPVDQILTEIHQCAHLLVNHRDDYGEHRGWKSFCIHGKSLHQTKHCDDDRPFVWIPEIEKRMPDTVSFFKNWPGGTYQRIRVMALEPNGYVSLHRDCNTSGLSPINIAITQPKNCKFIMEGWGEVPFQSGTAYMLDISNNHAVFNDSDQVRYHIIVHSDNLSDKFQSSLLQSYCLSF